MNLKSYYPPPTPEKISQHILVFPLLLLNCDNLIFLFTILSHLITALCRRCRRRRHRHAKPLGRLSVGLQSTPQPTDFYAQVWFSGSSAQNRASNSTQSVGDAFRVGWGGGASRLGIGATPQLSPSSMNYTCLASHLPRSSLCNVSHAWRIVCVYECLCGCIYIQTGIEGTVTHSLCSLFLPHNLPTHPPLVYSWGEDAEKKTYWFRRFPTVKCC